MENLFLFLLYIAFAFILGILSVVLKKKHTQLYNKSTPHYMKLRWKMVRKN